MSEMHRVRADEGVPDEQAAADMALGIRAPVRGAVGAEEAGFGEGPSVAAIGLDLPRAGGVHGGEVGVRDDHLVAQPLQAAGHPFALGGGLEQDPRPGPIPEHGGEALRLAAHPAFDQFASLREDADLAFLQVDVHANMVHGWPLLSAALTACVLLWGSVRHHVEREASRFILSSLTISAAKSGGGGGLTAARERTGQTGRSTDQDRRESSRTRSHRKMRRRGALAPGPALSTGTATGDPQW